MSRVNTGIFSATAAMLCAAFFFVAPVNRAQPLAASSSGQFGTSSQQQSTGSTPTTRLPSIGGSREDPSEDPLARVRQAQIARGQNNERQKRIVDDTDKLLRLATELKADVDKSNKDQLSLEVIRKAEEVEKLAHDVKTRMRG